MGREKVFVAACFSEGMRFDNFRFAGLIPVFNKTVKNRFIWLMFQQPAA